MIEILRFVKILLTFLLTAQIDVANIRPLIYFLRSSGLTLTTKLTMPIMNFDNKTQFAQLFGNEVQLRMHPLWSKQ